MNYKHIIKKANKKQSTIEMGFLPVKYPDIDKQLYLIMVKVSWLQYPMYLLTDINPDIKAILPEFVKFIFSDGELKTLADSINKVFI